MLHKHHFVNLSLENFCENPQNVQNFHKLELKPAVPSWKTYLSGQLSLLHSNMKWCVPSTVYGSALQADPRTLL